MPYPKGPRLGQVGRRSLRLADPPPGGFAPTPHHLRDSAQLRQEKEAERKAQREVRELKVFERFALLLGLVLVVVIAVFITIVVASH
jgi:hypothetical protein